MQGSRLLTQVNDQVDAQVAIHDRALAYGDGLFETVRIVAHRPVLLDMHWQRLERGLARLQIPLCIGIVQGYFEQFVARVTRQGCFDGIVKMVVSRSSAGRGFAPPIDPKPAVYLSWHELPEGLAAPPNPGIALHWCRQRLPQRPWLAGLKHLNCLEYVLAGAEVAETDCTDGVLCDSEGRLIETTCANLFLVQGSCLLTPALEQCGIAGTMRRWIMESQSLRGQLVIGEAEIREADMAAADEVFVCNSVFGIKPVLRLGRFRWSRGPVTDWVNEEVWNLFHHG